jgi:hypothetical protein
MTRIIELVESLQPVFKELRGNSTVVAVEAAYSRTARSIIEWRQLSDDERQNKRKGAIHLYKKWDSEQHEGNFTYSENLIIVYDMIRELLGKIGEAQNEISQDLALLRFESVLRIEKYYLDDSFTPTIHLPDVIFENLIKDIDSKFPEWNTKSFLSKYAEMYNSWPNRPDTGHEKM